MQLKAASRPPRRGHLAGRTFCRDALMMRSFSPSRFASSIGLILLFVAVGPEALLAQDKNKDAAMRFHVTFPDAKSALPLDGRILLMLSTDNAEEPRFQITGDAGTQLVFGINVDGLKPGGVGVVDRSVLGYPIK